MIEVSVSWKQLSGRLFRRANENFFANEYQQPVGQERCQEHVRLFSTIDNETSTPRRSEKKKGEGKRIKISNARNPMRSSRIHVVLSMIEPIVKSPIFHLWTKREEPSMIRSKREREREIQTEWIRSTLRGATSSFPAKVHRPRGRFYSRHDDGVLTTETANRNWWLRIHHRRRPPEVESLSGIPVPRHFLSVKRIIEKIEILPRYGEGRVPRFQGIVQGREVIALEKMIGNFYEVEISTYIIVHLYIYYTRIRYKIVG